MHSVEALLRHAPERVLQLSLQRERDDKRLRNVELLAQQHGIKIQRLPRQRLDRMQGENVHQGIIAEIRPSAALNETALEEIIGLADKPLLLVLDNVQDPHNLGACMRTAEAAGVNAIIVPRDKSAGLSATVRKVACGAAELLPLIQVVNLSRTLKNMQEQGIWVIGAAGEAGESVYQVDLNRPLALALGAEGSGLRRLTAEQCDKLVHIPMYGSIESLNVSVAAGVLLYEAVRQRHSFP